ncbi:MAG: hypothetical protein WDM88_01720 [Galbitalea sp.]
MLQSNPDINLIAGSDQGLEGALQALASAKKTDVTLVGFGASAAGVAGLKAGTIYTEVAQMPASEGPSRREGTRRRDPYGQEQRSDRPGRPAAQPRCGDQVEREHLHRRVARIGQRPPESPSRSQRRK